MCLAPSDGWAARKFLGSRRAALRADHARPRWTTRSGKALEDADLAGYASELSLDLRAFEADLTSGRDRGRIERDVESGARAGVRGTPTLFLDGRPFEGYDADALRAAL